MVCCVWRLSPRLWAPSQTDTWAHLLVGSLDQLSIRAIYLRKQFLPVHWRWIKSIKKIIFISALINRSKIAHRRSSISDYVSSVMSSNISVGMWLPCRNYGLQGLEAAPQAQAVTWEVSICVSGAGVCVRLRASACLSVIATHAISDAFSFTQKSSLSRGYC